MLVCPKMLDFKIYLSSSKVYFKATSLEQIRESYTCRTLVGLVLVFRRWIFFNAAAVPGDPATPSVQVFLPRFFPLLRG